MSRKILDAEVEYDRCSGYIDEPEDVGVDELGEHLILETPALLARRISFSEEKANYYLFDGAKLDRRQFKLTGSSICSVATSPYAGELQLLPLALQLRFVRKPVVDPICDPW